jgi:hypothetical protein
VKTLGGSVRIVGDAKSHATRELLAEIVRRFGPPTSRVGDPATSSREKQ